MIRYLQLPFYYDAEKMAAEVNAVQNTWKRHFNEHDYTGDWSGISLRAPGGAADNLFTESFNNEASFEDTPLMSQCPYIKSVIGSLQCVHTSVRLLKLDRNAVVKEHTDAGLNFEEGEARLHIPVVTHPDVEFYLDNHRLTMQAGECWYINASLPHRLSNPSPVHRIHLVIDCMVNEWLQDLFLRNDLPVKNEKDMTAFYLSQQQQIIAELRSSGDPQRVQLADDMEQALNVSS